MIAGISDASVNAMNGMYVKYLFIHGFYVSGTGRLGRLALLLPILPTIPRLPRKITHSSLPYTRSLGMTSLFVGRRGLKCAERTPRAITLGSGLHVVREVGEEVKARPRLDLVDGSGIVRVAIRVGLMLEPEAYGAGVGNGTRAICRNLHCHLIEVVWHGDILRIILSLGVFDALGLAHLVERNARDDIYLLPFANCLQCGLELLPYTAIEVILNLWYGVRHVECLQLHVLYTIA